MVATSLLSVGTPSKGWSMAINRWVITTLNTATGANPIGGTPTSSTADGGSVTLAWDNAVITTQAQLRACLTVLLQNAAGQLTGP